MADENTGEVARRDLVAEGLADLTDAERRLLTRSGGDIRVVDEDALRGLGAQVVQARFVVNGAEIGFEQARGARFGPGAGLAGHGVGHHVEGDGVGIKALALRVLFDELVGAVALVGVQGFDEGVGEGFDVAEGDPGCREYLKSVTVEDRPRVKLVTGAKS